MSDNMPVVSMPEKDSIGTVTFANEVISIIAGLAATEIPGVAGMSGGLASGVTEMLGRKNFSKGVKVEAGNEEAAIDVSIIVDFGVRIIEVSRNIQENIKKSVENMTGLRVVEVNVHVLGVRFKDDNAAQAAPELPSPAPSRVR